MKDKEFKTTASGVGPYCVEYADGEIVSVRHEKLQHLLAAAHTMYNTLEEIVNHLDPDSTDADNYRADDPEGAMDMAHALAMAALQEAKGKPCAGTAMTEHTPTPWRVGPYGGIYPLGTGSMIASSDTKSGLLPRATENEAFIVESVNSHDKLRTDRDAMLSALQKIANLDYTRAATNSCACAAHEIAVIAIDEAIAAAEGKDAK